MTDMTPKEFCMAFLRSHEYGVLATITPDGKPQVATVTYLIENDFTFYFATRRETRKSKNLERNRRVALVVGAGPESVSVQIEGTAEALNESERGNLMERFLTTRGSYYRIFLKIPGYDFIFFKITPDWIRLFRISQEKKEVYTNILPS